MSIEDAKKAIDIGCTAIMISNHGGRQLDGSRAPFDQLAEIVDAVGDKIEVILDGGVRRGSHVLKALALGAKACSFGKGYLFALSAGGETGVELMLQKMKDETDAEIIQTEIYQIGKDYEFENLRDWFKLIYQVLFGKDDGPRFGTFVAIYGIEKTIKLIESRLT